MIDADLDSELPTLSNEPDVLLIGVSTRAAAFSARRAGLTPLCIDQFSDVDLQSVARTIAAPSFPQDVERFARDLPPIPVIYGGGCENQWDLLSGLAQQRPVWGNPAEVLQRIRDPKQFHEVLQATRLPALEIRSADNPPPVDGTWLVKPLHSGGGRGIQFWNGTSEADLSDCYFQKYQKGSPCSAVFLAGKGPGDVRFVGLTRQLLGMPEFGGSGFQWCGNIGPINLDVATEMMVRRLGNILKWKFELVGLFGIDFVVDESGTPWPTEVNPRYTASVELLEWACDLNLLGEHCRCFDPHVCIQPFRVSGSPGGEVLGKAILYAPSDGSLQYSAGHGTHAWEQWPELGDLPAPGQPIAAGSPICTLYTSGSTEAGCLNKLKRLAEERMSKLWTPSA